MRPMWLQQPERSTRFWLRTIVWIALRLGRAAATVLLYPITAYFLVFSDRSRRASEDYLGRVLGRPCRLRDSFRHYHTFACTLLDRVYVFAGQDARLDIRVRGFEVLERQLRAGSGCLLVGAHLGSFEIIRAVGRLRRGLRIKALVYGENSPKITSLFRKLNPELFEDIVSMGSATSLVGLDHHVRAGGVVALLGDRSVHGEKRVQCQFFGEPAWFPQAPVLLAHILHVPMLFFLCVHQGAGRYEVIFEPLAETVELPRQGRETAVRAVMQAYAERLERHCRRAPYNWFNFYDFWQMGD